MKDMVDTQIINRGISTPAVIQAMRTVDRSLFVRDTEKDSSFDDTPLPIGFGQTISQPYIVAYMTEKLQLSKSNTVLEIGTGSGYQTAILASMAEMVYSVERIEELSNRAGTTLQMNNFLNTRVMTGDGYYGWKDKSTFDAIIVTAAAPSIPEPLINQLKDPGRLIIPVGPQYGTQYLTLIIKNESVVEKERLIPVRFVPFISNSNF